MSLLTVKLQLGLPYRTVWINWSSPWDKIYLLIFLILFKRVCLGVSKLGKWRKKCGIVSVSLPQSHNGFRVSWKQCLNLWSQKWLRPRRCSCLEFDFISIMNLKSTICKRSYKVYKVLFKNWETFRVSNFPIKFFPLRYSRRKEPILEIILFRTHCRNVTAMSGFINSVQVKNQIE